MPSQFVPIALALAPHTIRLNTPAASRPTIQCSASHDEALSDADLACIGVSRTRRVSGAGPGCMPRCRAISNHVTAATQSASGACESDSTIARLSAAWGSPRSAVASRAMKSAATGVHGKFLRIGTRCVRVQRDSDGYARGREKIRAAPARFRRHTSASTD